jgi:hypothetical protein
VWVNLLSSRVEEQIYTLEMKKKVGELGKIILDSIINFFIRLTNYHRNCVGVGVSIARPVYLIV